MRPWVRVKLNPGSGRGRVPLDPAVMAAKHLLSDECSIAINHLASYELHVSDAYLSMTCNSIEDSVEPLFANFFEYQAEFLDEQNDDTNDLQFQLGYCKELENQAQDE
ncbi:hypothetical protein QTO34_018171 [Cnephaeus nilssonii]|uniref:Uncharacterized protein n=1 Tax=Cnephaeus nilssonii TaxID=3371016 RepID=A0AA40HY98_CNENI|nr:hypothetical protein QTO34_018171 [Eptesicus nilssonii]